MHDLRLGFDFLAAQSGLSLIYIFWYTLLFELPRYGLTFLSIGLGSLAARISPGTPCPAGEARPRRSISVIVVGHNEASKIERCLRSIREQSLIADEIVIVSDGSTDAMAQVGSRLVREGLATRILKTDLRGGKSGGTNLAIRSARGDIIVVVDCDCSFDRFAIENIIMPLCRGKGWWCVRRYSSTQRCRESGLRISGN
jgi:cellulose synthase/poly-beta-1,6-N-acetylglucosamine synthase-like glycosyltransferase